MIYFKILALRAPNQIISAVFILMLSPALDSEQVVKFFTILELSLLLSIALTSCNDLTLSRYVKENITRERSPITLENYFYRFLLLLVCLAAIWPLDAFYLSGELLSLSVLIVVLISFLKLSTMALRALNCGLSASLLDVSALLWLSTIYLLVSVCFGLKISIYNLLAFYIVNICIILFSHNLILRKTNSDYWKNIYRNFSYDNSNIRITISQFCSQLINASPILFIPLMSDSDTAARVIVTMKIGFLINSMFLVVYNLNQRKIIVDNVNEINLISMRGEVLLLFIFTTIYFTAILTFEMATTENYISFLYAVGLYFTFVIKAFYGHIYNAAQMLADEKISSHIFIFNCAAIVCVFSLTYYQIGLYFLLIPTYSASLIAIIKLNARSFNSESI